MNEDQQRDEVMGIYRQGKAMRASDEIITQAIAYFFVMNGYKAPKSLVEWLGASGRYVRNTVH
ncbi:hypothetical protein NKH86_11200 [Mesorhizobium sp. M0913]|uniref:hypothetical protein n=1 Tax=Mesorhizobium sp. M0913 TaxID=2957026 RepID=UPI00333DCFBD